MTTQVSNSLTYDGQTFEIIKFSNADPFYSLELNLNPVPASTACWRGYYYSYLVKDYRLYLNNLIVNHSDDNKTPSKTPPPPINDIEAFVSSSPAIGKWQYNNIELFLDYTGKIIIARDFNHMRYGDTPLRLLSYYKTVYELDFSQGVLLDSIRFDEARLKAIDNQAMDI